VEGRINLFVYLYFLVFSILTTITHSLPSQKLREEPDRE